MAQSKSGYTYDMGAISYNENISKRIAQFTREDLYIGIPARVVGVDDYESLQCVDVQPVFDDVHIKKNSTVLEAVTIKKVFVKLPSGGGFNIKLPVSKGDLCTLNYAHKDLGEWLDSVGDENIAQSVFKVANVEDCWVDLGFGTRKTHQNPSADNLVIEGPNTTITITPSGDLTADTAGTSYIKSSAHTIDTDTTITGNLTVNGNTTIDGTTESTGIVTATAGVYAASYAGLAGGAATFNVDMNITGTVTIDGIVVNTHTHLDAESRPTGAMQ